MLARALSVCTSCISDLTAGLTPAYRFSVLFNEAKKQTALNRQRVLEIIGQSGEAIVQSHAEKAMPRIEVTSEEATRLRLILDDYQICEWK